MAAAKAKAKALPALAHLKGVLMVLDNRTKRPTAELLVTIREMVGDAMAVLQEPDPVMQQLGTAVCVLRQTSEVKARVINGKRVVRLTIHDHIGFNWAMEQLHTLVLKP